MISKKDLEALRVNEIQERSEVANAPQAQQTYGHYEVASNGVLLQIHHTRESAMSHYFHCQTEHAVVFEIVGDKKWKLAETFMKRQRMVLARPKV